MLSRTKQYMKLFIKSFKAYPFYLKHKNKIGLSGSQYLKLMRHGLDKEKISNVKFLDRSITIGSSFWFLHSVNELFIDEVYRFETNNPKPVIIDCGANWGLSIIYFKLMHPAAVITGFEPDKEIFSILAHNIASFKLQDVKLEEKAIWKNYDTLRFSSEGTLGGSITGLGTAEQNVVEVKTVRLKDILIEKEKVDFLKIDIEGAEYEVIKDCADELHRVDRLFIEYHSAPGQPQQLSDILRFVHDAGFRYYIKEAWNNMQYPFDADKKLYYDLQLNIFCYR